VVTPKDLIVNGGPQKFINQLHVGLPHLGPRKLLNLYIDRIYKSRRLSNHGAIVRELETIVGQQVQAECVAVCNATIGLQLVAKAMNLSGEVIVPTFTFIATVNALRWIGLTPVFCDVGPDYLIDFKKIEKLITAQTSAIFGVHLWGQPCHIAQLRKIADKHDLKLVFDAAHAFGCSWHGQPIGSFGDVEVFSFHATKFINCGEGGAITTVDKELAKRLRLMIKHGFDTHESISMDGTNAKMPEVNAAMGLTCLFDRKDIISHNFARYCDYDQHLSILHYDPATSPNYQYVVARVQHRDLVAKVLWSEGVFARKYFYPPCHQLGPNKTDQSFPQAEDLAQKVLVLPTGPTITSANVKMISDLVSCVIKYYPEISCIQF